MIDRYKDFTEIILQQKSTRALELSRNTQLLTDKAHYWAPDALPMARAFACVQIVLLRSEEANRIYSQIRELWGKPDCLAAMEDFTLYLLDSHQHTKHVNRMKRIYDQTGVIPSPEISFDTNKYDSSNDFEELSEKIKEFIKVGFNNTDDKTDNKYKVVASTEKPCLFYAVTIFSLAEFCKIKLSEWNEFKKINIGNKTIDLEARMNNINDRYHRQFTQQYKKFKHVLVSDKALLKYADIWYKCRVDPGSLIQYVSDENEKRESESINLTQEAFDNLKWVDKGRVSNDIRPYDIALGYPI